MASKLNRIAGLVGEAVGNIETATAGAGSKAQRRFGDAASAIVSSSAADRIDKRTKPIRKVIADKATSAKKVAKKKAAPAKRKATSAKKVAKKKAAPAKRKATSAKKVAKKKAAPAKRKATSAKKVAKKKAAPAKRKATSAKKVAKKKAGSR